MGEINSDLYSKEGDTRYKLNPSSTAEQIYIADTDGNASNVSKEIISLRTRLSAVENGGLMYKVDDVPSNLRNGGLIVLKETS